MTDSFCTYLAYADLYRIFLRH